MLMDIGSRRAQAQDDIAKLKATKNTDVLYKAQSMGKRIYTIEKLQRILENLLTGDEHASRSLHSRQPSHETNLVKLLQNERLNGPSDRDPRAALTDLHYFRGPYIYVYDMNEKTRPIMVREYAKVADKTEGEWPQFKTAPQGRCPFVGDDVKSRRVVEKKPAAAEKSAVDRAKSQVEAAAVPAKQVTGKRPREEYADPLGETKNAHNRLTGIRPTELFNAPKNLKPRDWEFGTPSQKFFTGRAGNGRMLAGEPVASGLQPSNVTSAIRSQVVSSNANMPGGKAGTSREVQNLQRKVLAKANPTSQDPSSRRLGTGHSIDGPSSRLASFAKPSGRVLESVEEAPAGERRAVQAKAQMQALPQKSKKDMKPGYCENCQDKFDDFDDVSNPSRTLVMLGANPYPAHCFTQASEVCRVSRQLGRA
jgi:regulatory subunit for Cdc7p protein kinase